MVPRRGGAALGVARCVVLALGVLAATGCGPPDPAHQPSLHSDESLADALERAAAYFAKQVLKGDQVWMARQGAWLIGGEFEIWAEALFVEERLLGGSQKRLVGLSMLRSPRLSPLPAPRVDPVPDPVYRLSRKEVRDIHRTMGLASRCTELDAADRKTLRDLIRRPGRSYVVTHQLWALVAGYHLGCFDEALLHELREPLATPVLRELLADTALNDLMAERMAMLCYAGLEHWIPPSAVELALESQHASGVWVRHQVDMGPHATTSLMHASTLAFYALACEWASERGQM